MSKQTINYRYYDYWWYGVRTISVCPTYGHFKYVGATCGGLQRRRGNTQYISADYNFSDNECITFK